jgi:hypothetical protein
VHQNGGLHSHWTCWRSQYPLAALMVAYTMLKPVDLGQPIVESSR